MPENDVAALARRYWGRKNDVAMMEDAIKAEKDKLAELEIQLHDAMVESGLEKVSIDGVSYRPEIKVHAAIDKDFDEALAFGIIAERGFGGLIKATINATTYAAFVREQMQDNDGEVPAWIAEFTKVYRARKVATRRG